MAIDHDLSLIGTRRASVDARLFGMRQADRRQHLYVIGKSGSGKTTLLENLLMQDIEAGRGCALLDPHGDLAATVLDALPPRRTDDLVVFDPADLKHPVSLNLFEAVPRDRRPFIASGVVATFKHQWRESWGPRLEYVLYNTVAALLDFAAVRGATLLGVPRMLVDERYRAEVIRRIEDARVKSFWTDEFARYDGRFLNEAIAPIENKVGQLLTSPALRNTLGAVKSTIRPAEIMDRRQILIARLPKGELGDQAANLLGSLLVTSFWSAAVARASMPEEERTDFQMMLDEFHNFESGVFASMLSEARKYGLGLTIAHQYGAQASDAVLAAILGNVGTLVAFRVGADDAAALGREFSPVGADTLRELGRGEACVRLLRDGELLDPFIARTLPPQERGRGRYAISVAQSRRRYGRPRAAVEGRITRWLGKG